MNISDLRAAGVQYVKVAITDIEGILRGKYIHIDKFASALEQGFGFCDVVFGWDIHDLCYDNVKYTGWHTGYPDALAKLDHKTLRHIPWEQDTPFLLADFYEANGEPLAVCPRQVLKKVIAKAEALGFTSKFALEFEFFNFRETPQSMQQKNFADPEPITPGMFGYSLLRAGAEREYFRAIMDELHAFGVPLEGFHTETGPGVYEAAILYADPLEAADRAVLFKTAVKEIGARFGIMPSFMAKWNAKLPGCSGHIHQSLWQNGRNVFYDEKNNFSEIFKHYLAGQMQALREILPFFAPNVNSYKRLVEGMWAPTQVTWGVDNRTTSFRALKGSDKSTRLETRVSGSDVNPYLAIAAALASGLHGIENKLVLAEPVQGSAYNAKGERLPRNLHEATVAMQHSAFAKQLFGETFVEHFAATRAFEWKQYQTAVTSWELQRYFELV